MEWKVPLFELEYDEREERAVLDVLRSGWLTMGDRTAEFERAFAEYVGARHAIAVASGTAALHLAVRALGIGCGDEVIVPDLTFVATANAVLYEGATPVFADIVGAHDLTLDPEDVARKVTDRTRAIIVMHYGGYPCRMREIRAIAEERGLAIIEDAAHAPGTEYEGVRAGALGDVACFSFFTNKNLSVGEGGMVTTNEDVMARDIRLMRSHGMTSLTLDRHRGHVTGYDVVTTGFNYRLTEVEAALGLVQLEKLDAGNARRRELTARYVELLADVPGVEAPFADFVRGSWDFHGKSACHIMEIVLPSGTDRTGVQDSMREAGVQTSVHYRPLHAFSNPGLRESARVERLSRIDTAADRLLTLPLWPGMGQERVRTVVTALKSTLGG